MDFAVKASITA